MVYPPEVPISDSARDLIEKLLQLEPQSRLGANNDYSKLKSHPFFTGINFSELSKIVVPVAK